MVAGSSKCLLLVETLATPARLLFHPIPRNTRFDSLVDRPLDPIHQDLPLVAFQLAVPTNAADVADVVVVGADSFQCRVSCCHDIFGFFC
jgi:hypothetical protein